MDYLKEFETNLAYYFSQLLEYPYARPNWIYISLSHQCTYNCRMCGVVKILQGYELSKEKIESSLTEVSQWDWNCSVALTGGEPFLRKDIFAIVDYSVKLGLKTEIVSNGALINQALAKKVIGSGLSNIAISLDGRNEATHDYIREKGSFQKATGAIRSLVDAKKSQGFGPQISVWTTMMKENVAELFDIISLVRDLGAECLVYHPVIVAQEDMQNTSSSAYFWIRKEDLYILKEQIEKIVDYQSKFGLVAFLHDPHLWIKYFEEGLTKQDWRCNPFVFINIGPDGAVRSCGSAFGNIKENSLDECLKTEMANKARRLMKACQKPCLQTCWAHPQSNSLVKIVDNFINAIKSNGYRENIFKQALEILDDYADKLRACRDA